MQGVGDGPAEAGGWGGGESLLLLPILPGSLRTVEMIGSSIQGSTPALPGLSQALCEGCWCESLAWCGRDFGGEQRRGVWALGHFT